MLFFIITIIVVATIVLSIAWASTFEWLLHRYFMHKPFLGIFLYPYEAHTKTHHRIFKYDHTYHLVHEKDKWTIPMAWWNWLILVPVSSLPFLILAMCVGWWGISYFTPLAVLAVYYAAYEGLHWCMHQPKVKKRLIERSPLFRRLNGHHLLHHRYMDMNYNVVCPLADILLGTYMERAPVKFPQARGHSVPDVQPIESTPQNQNTPVGV